MKFDNPWMLVLLPIILGVLVWGYRRNRQMLPAILFPRAAYWKTLENPWIRRLIASRRWVRLTVIILVFLAILRPQWVSQLKELSEPGVDVVIAMDVSGSMAAEDFSPDNRLVAAKNVAREFVESRPNDRIGMVVFGSFALTQCPLTTDHQVLVDLIDRIRIAEAGEDTAIGLGLATAVNRLRGSTAKSKVVILITDGVNNAGGILPEAAARIAAESNVKVYTIAIGKEGGAPIPYIDPIKGKVYETDEKGEVVLTQVDEGTLKVIAAATGGRYFRATDEKVLKSVYDTIGQLETSKSSFKVTREYTEWFPYLLWTAVVILILDLVVFGIIRRPLP